MNGTAIIDISREIFCVYLFSHFSSMERGIYHEHFFLREGKEIRPIEEASIRDEDNPKLISEKVFQENLESGLFEWDGILNSIRDPEGGVLQTYGFWFDESTLEID
jgi:hypothetical protein